MLKRLTKILPYAPVLLLCGVLNACNTMEGAGEDINRAGQAIENSAERNKSY